MFYLIAFILIILFVVESWKTTKTLEYYKKYYEESENDKLDNNKSEYNNNNINEGFLTTNQNNNKNNSNSNKKDNMFKHGYLPSNFRDASNFTLDLSSISQQEIEELENIKNNKFATSYLSKMTDNPSYFNPEKEKYIIDRRKRPLNWKCQREWYEYCS